MLLRATQQRSSSPVWMHFSLGIPIFIAMAFLSVHLMVVMGLDLAWCCLRFEQLLAEGESIIWMEYGYQGLFLLGLEFMMCWG